MEFLLFPQNVNKNTGYRLIVVATLRKLKAKDYRFRSDIMDKIDFGVFEDKETEEFGFPNFILDEFKLNFFDSSLGSM